MPQSVKVGDKLDPCVRILLESSGTPGIGNAMNGAVSWKMHCFSLNQSCGNYAFYKYSYLCFQPPMETSGNGIILSAHEIDPFDILKGKKVNEISGVNSDF